MNDLNVVFFGDSICVGQFVSIHRGWVPRLSMVLGELGEKHGSNIIVSNPSVNGRTTRQALERLAYEALSHRPDVMVVQFGMNDCNYWATDEGMPRVSVGSFQANLEEVLARGFNAGVRKILLNTNHPTGLDKDILPHTQTTYQQSNERYNQAIRDVASRSGPDVVLVDVEASFRVRIDDDRQRLEELLLPSPDLLHLSVAGHDLYAELFQPLLTSLVLELLEQPVVS